MRNLSILIIALLLVACNKAENSNSKKEIKVSDDFSIPQISKVDRKLKNYLVKNTWGSDGHLGLGYSLLFNDNQELEFNLNYEGDSDWYPKYYSISGGNVQIYYYNYEKKKYDYYTYILTNLRDSLYFEECLYSNETDTKFWNKNKLREYKGIFNIDEFIINSSERKVAKSTENTLYYYEPNETGKKYKFHSYDEEMGEIVKDNETNIELRIVGSLSGNAEWIMVLLPQSNMWVDNITSKKSYCWVKLNEISF